MPLHILLPIVAIGLLIAWGAIHFLGYSRELRMVDVADAARHWKRHRMGAEPLSVMVAEDGRAALIEGRSGLFLLRVFGIDTVLHPMEGAAATPTGSGITFRFADYAGPKAQVTLSPEEAKRWLSKIEGAAA